MIAYISQKYRPREKEIRFPAAESVKIVRAGCGLEPRCCAARAQVPRVRRTRKRNGISREYTRARGAVREL